jgi:hypothetical protein
LGHPPRSDLLSSAVRGGVWFPYNPYRNATMTTDLLADPSGHPEKEDGGESVISEEEPTSDARSTPSTPRLADTDPSEDEKDAQDHLTPAAMVHAASGIQLHRINNAVDLKGDITPRNVRDLKDSPDDETDAEDLDKVLSAVPPTLERQSAVPSQPGAFPAGGRRNDEDASVVSHAPGPMDTDAAPGLIEATLVDETPVEAPIYKGEVVEEEKIVKISRKYVRSFAMAFAAVCVVAVVLAVALVVANGEENAAEGGRPTLTNETYDDDDSKENSYWYLKESPQSVWETLDSYTFVTHHMAVVSIINPHWTASNPEGSMCTPLQYDLGNSSNATDLFSNPTNVSLRGTRRTLQHPVGRDLSEPNVVMVSFRCGIAAIDDTPQNAMILVHNAEGESVALLAGNTTNTEDIHCRDATFPNGTVMYNEVLCYIPNTGADGYYPFLFSCFSHMEEETVASVHVSDVSSECHIPNTTRNSSAVTASPAAVVLSTQRMCRISDGRVILEGNLLGEWNESSVTCSEDGLGDYGVSGVPVCRTSSATLTNRSSLEGSSIVLPNVTISDRLSDDERECSYTSVQNSLILLSAGFPRLQPLNETTLEQLEEYLINQELWVQQWLLQL